MRIPMVAALLVAALFAASPASAAEATPAQGGFVPAPQEAFELPAGARCDFAVKGQPVVDEVRKLVISSNPDGTPQRELFVGDLIVEVTNTETGAKTLADASGSALVEHHADGSQTWFAVGPVLLGFRENAGTLPRGLWLVDGVYTVEFSPDLIHKTITMVRGTTHNVCTDID
ncbi:MAG TPA: hypothetical protein VF062_24695 [Candidatus Limnocylindrales bacterium]